MSHVERKKMLVGAIRKLETRLVVLKYCEADCDQALVQRDLEIDTLVGHLHSAHSVLADLCEEELQEAA